MAVWRPHPAFSPPLQAARGRAVADYLLAGSAGLIALLLMVPLSTISGRAGLWAHPGGDAAVTLAGHLAFQAPGWHWPLLLAPALVWPSGTSIALTDSNPLMSLAAKLAATWRGHPANLLGVWLALCWVLQPVAALYALRGLRFWGGGCRPYGVESILSVAILSLLCPAWLMRFMHINLLAHFLLLGSLGLAFRMLQPSARPVWWRACLLLTAAVLIHPYLYLFAAVVLGAPALRRIIAAPRDAWRPIAFYALSVAVPAAIFRLASGGFGADRGGYGYYSLNLLSPVWPQLSGLFGPTLPMLDATGGQYEGFNYQGAGVLLLIAAALAAMAWRLALRRARFPSRTALACIAIPLLALTLIAATPNLFIGHVHVQLLAMSPWNRLFACIQSSGRAFWPVGYAMMIGSVAVLGTILPRLPRAMLLAAATLLQLIDTAPERAASARFFAGTDQPWPPFELPVRARLLRVVPPCDQNFGVVDLLRLRAVQQGMRLGDMRMARTPIGYDCRAALAADLNSPIADGELRFFLPASLPDLHPAALGMGVTCVPAAPGVVCSRVQPPAETIVRPAPG